MDVRSPQRSHHDDEEPDRSQRLTSRSGRSDLAGVAAARWSVFWMDEVGLDQAAIYETPDTESNHRLKPQQAYQREANELYA
jgi:hypothetical protein